MLKTYEENLYTIEAKIKAISENVVDALELTLKLIKNDDLSGLKDIDLSVKKLTASSNEIDNLIVKTLALYAPEAKDLRQVVSHLKIGNELIRAAGNTKEFIKLYRKAFSDDINKAAVLEYTIPLLKSAHLSLKTSINMFDEDDSEVLEEQYQRILVEESKTADLYSMMQKNILKLITRNIHLSKDYFDILTALRRIENVADRSISIARLLKFARIGGEIS